MRKLIIKENQNNKKAVQVITKEFSEMPLSALYKALRKKDIKLNGVRIKEDLTVKTGDVLEIYISDSVLINQHDNIEIVYEDKHIAVINKPQGLKVHQDKEDNTKSLIEILRDIYGDNVSLCHRLDRNTGGLIIAGKTKNATEIISDKIKNNEITKIYRCRVHGKLEYQHRELIAYHRKNAKDSLALISDTSLPGTSKIITSYDLLSYDKLTDTSNCDITLVTGKTHQIRAHMAHIGHPIVGDGKYGSNEIKKKLGEKHKYQELYAYKLIFRFSDPAGELDYLKNMLFEINPPIF